jgi:hypothetical protein
MMSFWGKMVFNMRFVWGRVYMDDFNIKKEKGIPVTGHRSTQDCETSRISHFLDNRFTDSSEAVHLMCWLLFTPRKISGTHFC